MTGFTRKLHISLGLFVAFFGVYFFTYQGRPISTDELILFDAAHSFTQNGTLELHYTSDLRPFPVDQASAFYGLDSEPLQAYLGSILVWLGLHLPGIGILQTAWTFNLFITALTDVLFYHYVLLLGYKGRTALLAALGFGLATYVWVYSKLFFREPLFVLLVLLCAYGFERWRQAFDGGRFQPGWFALSVLALVTAYFAKQTVFLLIPTFVVIAFPTLGRETIRRHIRGIVLLGLIAIIGALVFRYLFIRTRGSEISFTYTWTALSAYLFSPGFSLWASSPILVIGWGGAVLLIRERRYRELLVPLIALLSVTFSYALLQGPNWYGGTGWGARYLLPLTPFMMLWALPVMDRLLARTLPRWAVALTVGLMAFSFFVQVVAVSVPTTTFSDYLIFESNNLSRPADDPIAVWREGIWNPLYIPGVVTAQQARTVDLGFAWAATGTGLVTIPLSLLMVIAGIVVLTRRIDSWRTPALYGILSLVLIGFSLYAALRAYASDPYFTGNYAPAFQMLDKLKTVTQPGDAIILNDSFYRRVFMNYYRGTSPVFVLNDAPGERLGANPAPEVITDNPEGQAPPAETMIMPRLAAITSRWWFVTEFGPYSQGRLRPSERFLDRHYFPVQEAVSELDLRLIEYAPISAPPDSVPPWPSHKVGADFGAVYLVGCDLPRENVKAGSILPVSLLWRHDNWPTGMQPFDYSVNVSLVDQHGSAVAQKAGPPLAGFGQMSQWTTGSFYRDNYGLALPPDLAPGQYDVWVLVYNWQDNSKLPIRNAPNGLADHVVIAHITVQS